MGKNKGNNNPKAEGKRIEEKKTKEEIVTAVGGVVVRKLEEPIKFNDVDIKEIKLNFGALTGKQICNAEEKFQKEFESTLMTNKYETGFHAAVASEISGIPFEAILEMKYKDFNFITDSVMGFLIA